VEDRKRDTINEHYTYAVFIQQVLIGIANHNSDSIAECIMQWAIHIFHLQPLILKTNHYFQPYLYLSFTAMTWRESLLWKLIDRHDWYLTWNSQTEALHRDIQVWTLSHW
jgi:hypothetical protein